MKVNNTKAKPLEATQPRYDVAIAIFAQGRSYHAKILAKSKRFANPCFDVTKKPKNLVKHFPPKFIVALHKMVPITFTNRGLSIVPVMSTIL